MVGTGGAIALSAISVSAGDTLSLWVEQGATSPVGAFTGVELTLDHTVIPEPSSALLMGLGLVGLSRWRTVERSHRRS